MRVSGSRILKEHTPYLGTVVLFYSRIYRHLTDNATQMP